MKACMMCFEETDELRHLQLYVIGSEGIEVCLQCGRVLAQVARGVREAAGRARMRQLRAQRIE